MFGFLGPNGAGKSTTIRLLLDLIRPTSGSASILGHDCRADGVEAKRLVGYVPGDLRLFDRLTGREQLDSLARLRGSVEAAVRRMLVERFEVVLDRPIRELSKGNRQKLGLVQAFMHRPPLLVLDEPTSGLDPILQEEFRALLRETVADGRTVFLSSHSLDEVQHVADRVGDHPWRQADRRRLRRAPARARAPPRGDHVRGASRSAALRAAGRECACSGPKGTWSGCTVPEAAMDARRQGGRSSTDSSTSSRRPADLEEIFMELYREDDDGS